MSAPRTPGTAAGPAVAARAARRTRPPGRRARRITRLRETGAWLPVRARPVALSRPDAAVPIDRHLDLAPGVVALVVGRRITDQILIGQLVEQFLERTVQLIDALGREHAAAGRHRQP